jgi:uncharacterized cupredoxin-like copper-binding protein
MRLVPVSLLALVALVVAACGGAAATPSAAASAAPPAAPSAAATRIEVSLQDTLRIEPATMTVPAGVPVTFVVTNAGAVQHEFVVGDEEVQAEHEEEMAGGHMEDEENAIDVPPGETKELTMTFAEAGETLAGCHVTGHYDAGMKAVITIE